MTATMKKTPLLTLDEITFKRGIAPTTDMQRATLNAALRTGKRVGVSVEQARYNVVVCHYALTKTGRPTGSATVEVLASGLPLEAVIPALDALHA